MRTNPTRSSLRPFREAPPTGGTTGAAPAGRRRGHPAASLLLAWLCAACAGRDAPSNLPARTPRGTRTAAAASAVSASPRAMAEPVAGPPPAPATLAAMPADPAAEEDDAFAIAYDLVREAPTLEVAAPGLRLDLGTGLHVGATLGRWRTGWGRDGTDGGRTVIVAARSPVRLYLPADAIRGTTMRVTARPLGGRRVTADADGEPLGDGMLPSAAYGTVDFAVPDTLSGLVTVTLAFRGSGRDPRLGPGAALVDRIDFLDAAQVEEVPGAAADEAAAATMDFAVETGPPPALRQAPGTTLRAHLYLPRDARLRAAVAALDEREGTAVLRAVPDGGEALEQPAPAPLTLEPAEIDFDLSPLGGRAVRLELVASGPGGARWITPRVVVPHRTALPAEPRTARNLVVLLVDTLRADKLREIDASSEVDARNLLRWAREGTTFTRATAQENWTKPSVATLLTGLYPSSHTAQSERAVLPPEARLLSEYLHEQGFTTACFIANGYVSDTFGFRRGWDVYRNYVRGGLPNRARHVFADAAAWIAERKPVERFFLYVQTIDPHVPYIPPREFLERYDADPYSGPVKASETARLLERIKAGQMTLTARDRRRLEALYDGEITYHDAHVPKLYEALAALGVLDDTLVVVTADHGEEFFEHGSVGHGHSLYRELLHVPLLLRLPGRFRAATKVDAVVGLVDVAPTAFEALGLALPPAFQGRSLLALAHGGETGAEVAFSEFLEGQRAVTGQRYKLIQRGDRPLFYDLREDPGELRNVAGEQPIAARAMQVRLARFLEGQERAGRDERRSRGAPEAEIDPQLEARLRALGYLGGPP